MRGLDELLKGKGKVPSGTEMGMLEMLNGPGYNMYAGTASHRKVDKRRAKNRVAKKQRKRNARGK